MPQSHITKWHHINDCKIRKITADPAGGTTTYSTRLDVPGIKAVGVTGTVKTTELRGDNQLLDKQTIITGIGIAISNAKLSLDVLALMIGGSVTDSGTTPNMKAAYALLATSAPSYFELEAQTTGVDTITGDGHLLLPKCIISGFPDIGFAEEDYRIFSGTLDVVPLLSTGAWMGADLNETAVPLPAT